MTPTKAKLALYKDYLRSGRGADRVTAALANALAARGYDVHVITRQSPAEPLSVALAPGVTCHRVPDGRRRPFAKFLNKLLLRSAFGERVLRALPGLDLMRRTSLRLQDCLNHLRPDLILSSGSNEGTELTYAGPLPAPFLQLFHVYPPTSFQGKKYRRAARFRAAIRRAAACQVLLPSFRDLLRPYTDAPVAAIGNAIDWPADEPLPDPATREKTIVYVAYFSKDKNHLALLEAFAKLRRADDWRLCLCGSGTSAWERRLRERAEALGVAGRVVFQGVVRAPRPLLLRAGICAYPSQVEGFGLALAEAMWCGLPCVGFAEAPGVNGLIVDGATGLLAAPGAEAFAAQLQRLVDDPALRANLGARAATFTRHAYAAPHIWEQWDDLVQSLLAKR